MSHSKNIKNHLLKRIDERFNIDVSRSELKYFQNILKQSTSPSFITNRNDLVMKYDGKNKSPNRQTYLIDYKKRLICLLFEDGILKTVLRPNNYQISFWNQRTSRRKFDLIPKLKKSRADRIQELINKSNEKLIKREHWLKYHA